MKDFKTGAGEVEKRRRDASRTPNLNKETGESSWASRGVSQKAREAAQWGYNHEIRTEPTLFVAKVMWGKDSSDYNSGSEPVYGTIKVLAPNFSEFQKDMGGASYTTPSETDKQRWITCYPMFPLSGSDTANGDSSAHGFSYVPRVNDYVIVAHVDTNASAAVWLGCVPQALYQRVTGIQAAGSPNNASEFPLPTADTYNDGKKPSVTQTDTRMTSGLIRDPVRGTVPPGVDQNNISGYRSYGNQGGSGPKRIGQSLLFFDDPKYRGIRLITSDGAQVTMSDTTNSIYVGTQRSKAWLELMDDGRVYVYGENIYMAADKDFCISAGQDLNVDVGRDVNFRVKEDVFGEVQKDLNLTIGANSKFSVAGFAYENVKGEIRSKSGGVHSLSSGGRFYVYSGSKIDVLAEGTIKIHSNSAQTAYIQSGADRGPDPTDATKPKMYQVPGRPTPEQQQKGEPGSSVSKVGGSKGGGGGGGGGGGSPPTPQYPTAEPYKPVPTGGARYNPNDYKPNSPNTKRGPLPWGNLYPNGGRDTVMRDGPLPQRPKDGRFANRRAVRNNNPGAIEGGLDRGGPGVVGSDNSFDGQVYRHTSIYVNPKYGFAQQTRLLDRKFSKYLGARGCGPNSASLISIIQEWGPRGSSNPSVSSGEAAYVAKIKRDTGAGDCISKEQWNDPNFMFRFQKAQAEHELGGNFDEAWNEQDLADGIAMARNGGEGSGTPPAPGKDDKAKPANPKTGEKVDDEWFLSRIAKGLFG